MHDNLDQAVRSKAAFLGGLLADFQPVINADASIAAATQAITEAVEAFMERTDASTRDTDTVHAMLARVIAVLPELVARMRAGEDKGPISALRSDVLMASYILARYLPCRPAVGRCGRSISKCVCVHLHENCDGSCRW